MSNDFRILNIEIVRLDEIHEATTNPRHHSVENIAAIKDSLRRFGQGEPLVVRAANNEVIGGNGRLQALRDPQRELTLSRGR